MVNDGSCFYVASLSSAIYATSVRVDTHRHSSQSASSWPGVFAICTFSSKMANPQFHSFAFHKNLNHIKWMNTNAFGVIKPWRYMKRMMNPKDVARNGALTTQSVGGLSLQGHAQTSSQLVNLSLKRRYSYRLTTQTSATYDS